MTTIYTVHVGNNSTDLGQVGTSKTVLGARRIGRAAVRSMLPGGDGCYTIRDADGAQVERGERSLRTGREFAVAA